MLKVENLVKRFGDKYAVNDISFVAEDGEVIGLLGPNGAGKTTAMSIITGYLSYTSGSVTVDCFEILDNPTEAKKLIGYLPEQPPVYPDMTVWEYLNFVYELKGCTLPRKKHLLEICEVTKIVDVRNRVIRHLSKGYVQRVGIAQALVGNPKVIILDEPTVGLDPKQMTEIRSLITRLGRNHTVILSSHILSEVQAVCDRIMIMSKGRIVADERTEDLRRSMAGAMQLSVLIKGPRNEVMTALQGIGGEVSLPKEDHKTGAFKYQLRAANGEDQRIAVFNLCAQNNWPILGMENTGASLEDVFLTLTETKETKPARNGKKQANA